MYRENGLTADSPLLFPSPAPSPTARNSCTCVWTLQHTCSRSQPQAKGFTPCSVVCTQKEGPREEPHTVPESSTKAIWAENSGELCAWSRRRMEGDKGTSEHSYSGHIPRPHGLLALRRGETGRGPEQGPLNSWGFGQGTLLPSPMGKSK